MENEVIRQPVGILGGTFDPIHNGHLRMGIEVAERLNLNDVRLMPCHIPPHKASPSVSSQQRADMVALAADTFPAFRSELIELTADTPSYSVKTLRKLRAQADIGKDRPLIFIMGMDSLLSLKSWYEWENLFELCHLAVCGRPGSHPTDQDDIHDVLQQHETQNINDLLTLPCGKIWFVENNLLEISSTQIRDNIRQNRSNRFLIPENVIEFIKTHDLYRD